MGIENNIVDKEFSSEDVKTVIKIGLGTLILAGAMAFSKIYQHKQEQIETTTPIDQSSYITNKRYLNIKNPQIDYKTTYPFNNYIKQKQTYKL